MITNQTIDGVPRSLIERAITAAHIADCPALRNELRALLDAPAVESEPAARPQGDPVAHCLLRRNGSGEWVNDAKSWADGAPSREIMVDCEKHPELYRVRLAYAEQPAPVAVEGLEIVGRQCFPSDAMKAVRGYRKEPWVDGDVGKLPSEPGFYRIELLVRLSDVANAVFEYRQPAPERPAHANPPPVTEPCGTHHDNDGLDDYRNTK